MWQWLRKSCVTSLLCLCSLSGSLSAEQDKVVLLLSHPSFKVLTSFIYLVEQDKLSIPGLHILVLHHAREAEYFQEHREYVATKKLSWIEFVTLQNDVDTSRLFTGNAWSEQFSQLQRRADGIIFLGGHDLPPEIYGKPRSPLCEDTPTPRRHSYEASFLFHLLGGGQNPDFVPLLRGDIGYPVLGICLGMQTMNAACGGTLHQDIPNDVYQTTTATILSRPEAQHRNYQQFTERQQRRDNGLLHPIVVLDNSPLPFAGEPLVSSSHHQGVAKLGSNLAVWAMSPDGKIVEGIRHTQFPRVFAVQFHPEKQALWDRNNSLLPHPDSEQTTADVFLQQQAGVSFHERLWRLWSTHVSQYHNEKKIASGRQ